MHYNNECFNYSFMIIISKVITFMKHIKLFPNCVRYGSMAHVINGLGSKSGCGKAGVRLRVLPISNSAEEIRDLGQKSGCGFN